MTSSLQLCSSINYSIFLLIQGILAISKIEGLLTLSLFRTAFTNSYKSALVPAGSGSTG
jgi:hypothetical protein